MLLTTTEEVKLGDFGLAQEYIALKFLTCKARRDDGLSLMRHFIQYYETFNVGPIYWMAPEFFRCDYTEKADVFSFGAILFAILERDFININGKKVYGAFKMIPDVGKIGLGYTMEMYDPEARIHFSGRAQGSEALQSIALDTLQFDKNDRPSAAQIYDRVMSVRRIRDVYGFTNLRSSSLSMPCRTVMIDQALPRYLIGEKRA